MSPRQKSWTLLPSRSLPRKSAWAEASVFRLAEAFRSLEAIQPGLRTKGATSAPRPLRSPNPTHPHTNTFMRKGVANGVPY